MTPIDVQDHDWPSGRVAWLLLAVAALWLAMFFARDVGAWLVAMWRRDRVPRAELDAALAALTRTQIALDDARGNLTRAQRERDAAWRDRDDLTAQLAALTTQEHATR